MEPIHADLLRLATELEAVMGQVLTECNALRDLFLPPEPCQVQLLSTTGD